MICCATIFLVWCALNRLVAGDEGFYLLASRLVMQGQLPYRDFFYPQMPLLPYIYGAWMSLTGESWASARILSGGCAALLGLLIYVHCRQRHGRLWGSVALLLYVTSNFIFPWLTVAKTYSLSTLLLFASYVMASSPSGRAWLICLAGFVFGLAVNTRLFFAATVPIFYLTFLLSPRFIQKRRSTILYFSLGGIVTALPLLYFMCTDFDTFWFNNMGYHLSRSNRDFSDALQGKMTVLRSVLSLRDSKSFDGFQFAMLAILAVVGLILTVRRRLPWDMALPIALVLGIVSLIPTPTYIQYFSAVTPFLIIPAVAASNFLLTDARRRWAAVGSLLGALVVAITFCVYVQPFYSDLIRYTKSGIGVIGISNPAVARYKTVESFDSLGTILKSKITSDSAVVATWPGYVIGSGLSMLPGLENDFGLSIAGRITPEQRKRYHIVTYKELCDSIRTGQAGFAILTATQKSPKCFRKALEEAGFTKVVGVSAFEVFSRP